MSDPSRRRALGRLLGSALLAGGGASALQVALAQAAWPSQTVHVVIPYPPGGPTDVLARLATQALGDALGQPFVADNRPGASGMIGSQHVARAAANGYTLLANASIHVINPSLYRSMSFDPIADFAPISAIARVPLVLVVKADRPWRTVKDVIEAARNNSGGLRFASSGNGAAPHLAGEAFRLATGVTLTHIPYKGSNPALTDLLGGHVDLMFESMPSSMPHIRSGALRPLAVTTSARVQALPDVPTMGEAGVPDYEISTWYGLWAPRATSEAIVMKVSDTLQRICAEPAFRERLQSLGAEPAASSPQEFDRFQREEAKKYASIVERSGARID